MTLKRRTSLLYLPILWVLISLLAWPTFVVASTVLSYFLGQSWQLDAWSLIPKRELLNQFLHGYASSAMIAAAVGLVAVTDHYLLSRYRLTWFVGGILLPITGVVIAYHFYKNPISALPSLVLAGIMLAIVHRLADILAGNSRRRQR